MVNIKVIILEEMKKILIFIIFFSQLTLNCKSYWGKTEITADTRN